MTLNALILLPLLVSTAFAQDTADKPRVHHPPVVNTSAEHQSWMSINERRDWRVWISSNYPDNSASWPAACSKTLVAASNGVDWDFTGKGDFNKNGVPTALFVRFGKSSTGKKGRMIVKFSIAECSGDKWSEILGLDSKTGISANGEVLDGLTLENLHGYGVTLATGIKASPGLQIAASALDDKGRGISESVDFTYRPSERKYDVDAR
jgi:hypothetical protein